MSFVRTHTHGQDLDTLGSCRRNKTRKTSQNKSTFTNRKKINSKFTQSEPIGCRVEHLGHGDAEEVVQVAAPGAPARVLVTPEAVEKHVPGDENGH